MQKVQIQLLLSRLSCF